MSGSSASPAPRTPTIPPGTLLVTGPDPASLGGRKRGSA